jgi:RNA polymerase sigma-70 factor (ECF subfamily)
VIAVADVDDRSGFERTWKAHRTYLVDMAFRMLGDLGAAEDVVQEAFTRLAAQDLSDIEDARGWLTVVTGRLALNRLRLAHSRYERAVDFAGSDLAAHGVDPVDRVTLDDSVRLALLVVMERLSPAERVVFVLHDIFKVPFDQIATTIGRTAANCRQLAKRAREKLEEDPEARRAQSVEAESRRVVEGFVAACASGDFDALVAVLDPEVTGEVDLGAVGGIQVFHGIDDVAGSLAGRWGSNATLVSLPLGSEPAVLGFRQRELTAVLLLSFAPGAPDRIGKVHVVADPRKLNFLRAELGRLAKAQ